MNVYDAGGIFTVEEDPFFPPDLPLWAFLFTIPTDGEGCQHCFANHVLMMSGFNIISKQSNLMGKGFLLVSNSRAVANHDRAGVVAGVGGYMVTLHG